MRDQRSYRQERRAFRVDHEDRQVQRRNSQTRRNHRLAGGRLRMRRAFIDFFLGLVVLLGFSCTLFAQYGTGQAPKPAAAEDKAGPAPTHDLTGVWMMRNPPGSNRGYTNYTYTDTKTAPPSLTVWGEEKFKEAKDSNGGNYTLQETNDPVLTKCYPPGVPRVYFHPYPFEFVHTPKVTLMLFEFDHTIRRIYTHGRPLPKD